jgi:hypothetical protein
MSDMTPLVATLSASTEAAAAAADNTTIVGKAAFAGTVTAVTYTPEANITGANTDSRTVSLINKGADGNGTTVVATLAMVSGVNSLDFDDKAITLSATAADLVVADGDVLAWTSVHVGSTGLADPGGRVTVTLSRS